MRMGSGRSAGTLARGVGCVPNGAESSEIGFLVFPALLLRRRIHIAVDSLTQILVDALVNAQM